uniref:BOS complex subunit TMEM147 n=1 Tax=Geospiza parvula TaxID=87175 RepID=A0A8C3NGK4_GEOPR
MTLFHFGNCFALAYFPYFITYKCSGLSEYSAFWRCVQAGATYVLVQLGKMLFLATFFPTWEGPSGGYDLVGEFLRATVDVADLGGLQLALGRAGGRGELRILVAALGWASAELLTARCVPLWVGSRGVGVRLEAPPDGAGLQHQPGAPRSRGRSPLGLGAPRPPLPPAAAPGGAPGGRRLRGLLNRVINY